jgi:predicted Zn-dependent peptidase
MKLFNRTILDNGLRVITVPQKGSLSATILVLVEAGSNYETKKINGLSHFLEHMCFKGTTNRPTALDITTELDSIGAQYNAFTGQEYTGYYAKVRSEKLTKAVDIIADLYSNPVLNEEEIEKEKGVVIEELNMYEDLPPQKVLELFEELLYGDQPAGWPIVGLKEVISNLTKKDLLKYRQEHYVAKATAIVVVGSFDQKKLMKQLKEAFANIPSTKKFGKVKTKESQKKPQLVIQYKKSDQTHLAIGFRSFAIHDKRRFALKVMNNVLGGGMSSRLFQRVREQLGAAYYISSGSRLFADHGYWRAHAGIDHKKIHLVLEAILEEAKRLTEEPIEKKELQRAKDHLSGNMVLGLESSDELAIFYGMQEIEHRSLMTPQQILKQLNAVNSKEIMKVAKDIFLDSNLNLALIGPFRDKNKLNKNLRFN